MDTNTITTPSEKQVKFLRKLAAERMPNVDPSYTESVIAQGNKRVSQAISTLLSMPVATPVAKPRTNKYPGECDMCQEHVEAEDGLLSKADSGEWVVTHTKCPEPFPFPHGRYAVENEEGVLRFYIVKRRDIYVQSSDEAHKLPRKTADAIADKIEADPAAAAKRYGTELGQCGLCGRTLTDETSRAIGIGPVCIQRVGW